MLARQPFLVLAGGGVVDGRGVEVDLSPAQGADLIATQPG